MQDMDILMIYKSIKINDIVKRIHGFNHLSPTAVVMIRHGNSLNLIPR
jgi:hypothetical protein